MNSEEQKIIDIKVKYEDAIYGIVRFQEKLQDLKNTQQKLDEQFKNGEITYNEYTLQTEAAKNATKQYTENIRVLRKEIQNNLRTEQEQDGSLKQLRAQLSNATKAYDELSRAERQGAKGQELQMHIQAIVDELKAAEEETGRFQRNVGNYYNSMYDALADIQNSDFMRVDGPLGDAIDMTVQLGKAAEGAGTKMKAFGKSLMALMTNPVFLAIAGIVGTGMAFKFWYDYNKGLEEATRKTMQFTGLFGDEMKSVRNQVLVISEMFGVDFGETLQSANVMSKQFGISVSESLKLLQDGFVAGANVSDEFLKNVKEYPTYLKEAGLNAEQFVAISTNATKQGIFSDNGLDTIKEGNIRLREMTTATAAALDGIGISSEKVQKELQNGSKTTFDIMQEVGNKLKEFPASSAKVGAAIADIFGGAGEDAGLKYIETLGDIEMNMDKVKETTGEWGKQQEQLIEAQTELKNVTSALFDLTDNGFEEAITQARIFITQSLSGIIRGIVNITNKMIELYNESTLVRWVINVIGVLFRGLYETVKFPLEWIILGFKTLAKIVWDLAGALQGLLQWDFDRVMKNLKEVVVDDFWEGWKQLGRNAKKAGENIADQVVNGFGRRINKLHIPELRVKAKVDEVKKDTTNDDTNMKTLHPTTKTTSKKSDDAAKLEAQRMKEQEKEMQMAILRVQMEYNDKMIRAKQMYLAGFYEDEKQYQSDIEELQREEVARMLDVYVKAGAIGEQKAQEMQVKLLDMQIKFNEQLKAAAAKLAEQWRTEFEAQETERERQLIDQGILEEADNEARLERYKAFLEAKKQAYKDNAAALEEIDKESKDTEEKKEEESYEKKKSLLEKNKNTATEIANQITNGFSSAFAAMFAEQEVSFKAFMKSILVTTIDAIEKALLAYEASILAKEIASKSWAGVASAAALSALIAAAFEAAKAGVNSFAVGGYVSGAGTGTSDSIPARLSNGESVMTARATSMFSPLLSTFNQLGGGVPIVVNGGGASSIGEDFLAAAVAKGFMMCPAPVVSVEEINRVASRVKVIQTRGTI